MNRADANENLESFDWTGRYPMLRCDECLAPKYNLPAEGGGPVAVPDGWPGRRREAGDRGRSLPN